MYEISGHGPEFPSSAAVYFHGAQFIRAMQMKLSVGKDSGVEPFTLWLEKTLEHTKAED